MPGGGLALKTGHFCEDANSSSCRPPIQHLQGFRKRDSHNLKKHSSRWNHCSPKITSPFSTPSTQSGPSVGIVYLPKPTMAQRAAVDAGYTIFEKISLGAGKLPSPHRQCPRRWLRLFFFSASHPDQVGHDVLVHLDHRRFHFVELSPLRN